MADQSGLSTEVVWTGAGVVGALAVSPASLDFGSLLVGETREQALGVTNTGLAPVTIDALVLEGDGGYAAEPLTGALPLVVGVGSTTVLTVTFTAEDAAPRLGSLVVHSDDPHAPALAVPLSANTEAPNNRPVISLLSPADGDVVSIGQTYTLRAFALDAETPSSDLVVTFESALQGVLGTVSPDATGEVLLETTAATLGEDVVTATGADGLSIVAATGADPEDLLGHTGEQLGVGEIEGVTGFVIEVDVHSNASRSDPIGDHIALVSLPDYQHIGTPVEVAWLEDSMPHELVVDFAEGVVEVSMDGVVILTESVPDWSAFEGYLGATAATGSLYNRHVLERWDVETGCW